MAASAPTISSPWYLREWLIELGRTQADLVELTGWSKGRVNHIVTGKHRYNRDIIDRLAAALQIEPHQLLMRPDEALQLDRLREAALGIAAGSTRKTVDGGSQTTPGEAGGAKPRKKAEVQKTKPT